MESTAERCRHVVRAIPAQLDDARFLTGKGERGGKAGRVAAGVEDEIRVGPQSLGRGESYREHVGD